MNDLAFDANGLLYVAIGDSIFSTLAPNLNNVFGKVLRIKLLGNNSANGRYSIPSSNPFVGNGTALPEIYASGFRNPYRISIDRQNGNIYTADVGENFVEEINRVTAGGNFGWPQKEGLFVYVPEDIPVPDLPGPDGKTLAQRLGLIDPLADYDHVSGVSITGGSVYRGSMIPWLQNDYVFADLANFKGPLVLDLDQDDLKVPTAH